MRYEFLSVLSAAFGLLLAVSPAAKAQTILEDRSAAVILAYHRVGEDLYPDTNLRTEQFEAHLAELENGGYQVRSLPSVVQALQTGKALPPRTVVLTFDGAHQSAMDNAFPLLLAHNIPFTVFVATDQADGALPGYMDWASLRKLARNDLVTIGLHPASYTRLAGREESVLRQEINKARARFREALGKEPAFFAYPFGEFGARYRAVVAQQGFTAAFGQQSGVAYAGHDLFSLPRFPVTESYGGAERFRLIANALPLPVTDPQPADPLLATTRPVIAFTLAESLAGQVPALSCFASGQARPAIAKEEAGRVTLALTAPFEDGRGRVNCTLPVVVPEEGDNQRRWRWMGVLFTVPDSE